MGYYYFALLLPRVHALRAAEQRAGGFAYGADLYPIWLTGRELLWNHVDPYTPAMTGEIQLGLYGRVLDASHPGDPPANYRTFSYPLYSDVLALPLLPLPFRTVQIALTVVLPLLVAAMIFMLARALDLGWSSETLVIAVLLCLCSYPVLEAIYAQQPALLVGASLSGCALALARKQLPLAGVLLAVSTVKPQMVFLLALWLMLWSLSGWKTRKSMLIGFLVTLAVLLGVSEWMLPGWWREWWHVVAAYRQYTLPPLAGLLLGQNLGIAVEAALLAIAAIVGWRARREPAAGKEFWFAASLILAITVFILPTGDAVYDQLALLLPVLLLCSRRSEILNGSRPVRLLAILAVGIFLWQFAAGCLISFASVFLPRWSHSTAALLLPVRMASSFPVAILAILLLLVFAPSSGRNRPGSLARVRSSQHANERFAIRSR
jgi:Glycosyltransferase family 87